MGKKIELWDYTTVGEIPNEKRPKGGFPEERKEQIKEIKGLCETLQSDIDNRNYNYDVVCINGTGDDKPKIFAYYNDEYKAQKYAGIIFHGENKFIIGSRFDNRESDSNSNDTNENAVNNQFFLRYLLENVFGKDGMVFRANGISDDSDKDYEWNCLLMYLYIGRLQKALRKNVFKKYEQFHYNDSRVKGQIDIARHIRLNPIPNGKIAYNARERTAKNYYNVLFLRAFDMMKKKYPAQISEYMAKNPEIKRALGSLREQNEGWDTVKIRAVLKATDRKIVNPIYGDYEALRLLSRLIIRNLSFDEFAGEENKISGVLVDMTELWESFLYEKIFKDLEGFDVKAQAEFAILEGHRTIRPDFYLEEKRLVLDAKYRPVWEDTLNQKKWKGVREDVFQVLAYMLSLKCTKGGVIFPVKDESKDFDLMSVCSEGGWDYSFCRVPIYIPDNSGGDYNKFCERMMGETESIKEELKKKIEALT